jgi:nitric oxide reductase NorE protein
VSELRLVNAARDMRIAPEGDQPELLSAQHTPGGQAIWVFILGDMTMFACFFGQFAWDRIGQVELFARSQHALSITFGAVNTLLLLTGSLFVVLGVEAMKKNTSARAGRAAQRWFAFALICALMFGIDKVLEYSGKLSAGITPATNLFFGYYYMFTGIHALHLCIGMAFLARMWRLAGKMHSSPADIRFAEIGASYWHLVDLLWVVLFALLYLMN